MAEECPMGRVGEGMDVAPLVAFLASDSGEWVNGQVIWWHGLKFGLKHVQTLFHI